MFLRERCNVWQLLSAIFVVYIYGYTLRCYVYILFREGHMTMSCDKVT